jgi:poly(A) polymerase
MPPPRGTTAIPACVAIWIAWETGVLDVLLPELSTFLADRDESDDVVWRLLSELDRRIESGGDRLDDTLLWAALLLEPMREACLGERDRVDAAYEFLEPIVDRLNVPRRIADPVRRVVAALPRLESGRTGRFARSGLYPLAAEVSALRASCLGDAPAPSIPPAALEGDEASPAGGRRKRRRKRRPRADA